MTAAATGCRPIILIGLMGCGKTTVGRELSKMLAMPFLDMDAVIEEQIGKPIPAIFKDEGERHFRALETALLRYLVNDEGRGAPVISTGGGVIMREENRAILRKLGFCVWLDVDVDTLIARTARSNNRPLLLNTNRRAMLEKLSQQRAPLYAATAHLRLDSSRMDINTVVRSILSALQEHPNVPHEEFQQ